MAGDQELAQDDYYVQFSTDDGGAFGSGSYVEVNAFNTRYKLDNSTLPHRLINDDEDSFLLSLFLIMSVKQETTYQILSLVLQKELFQTCSSIKTVLVFLAKVMSFYRKRVNFLTSSALQLSLC